LFTLEHSRAERSKDHNKASAGTTKLQCSNVAQCIDMLYWAYIKRNWKGCFAPLCYAQVWTSL